MFNTLKGLLLSYVKYLILCCIAAIALGCLAAGLYFATMKISYGATSGNITISGTVPAATAIVVTPIAGYNTLDLTTTAVNTSVCTVREINNTTNGYTVSLSSSNSGQLKNGTIGLVTYTARYNGSGVTLSSTPQTVTNSSPSNSVVNLLKTFDVSFTGVPSSSLMQGVYSDTLTFIITAN